MTTDQNFFREPVFIVSLLTECRIKFVIQSHSRKSKQLLSLRVLFRFFVQKTELFYLVYVLRLKNSYFSL